MLRGAIWPYPTPPRDVREVYKVYYSSYYQIEYRVKDMDMKCKDVNVFWEWISQAVQGIKTNPEFVPDWSSLPSHLWEEAELTLDREFS